MKVQPGFAMRSVCGERFLIAEGEENIDFSKLITMNDTAVFLWEKMGADDFTADDLVSALLAEYEVEEAEARTDVDAFLSSLKEAGVIK